MFYHFQGASLARLAELYGIGARGIPATQSWSPLQTQPDFNETVFRKDMGREPFRSSPPFDEIGLHGGATQHGQGTNAGLHKV
jgi:hypothetical protein